MKVWRASTELGVLRLVESATGEVRVPLLECPSCGSAVELAPGVFHGRDPVAHECPAGDVLQHDYAAAVVDAGGWKLAP